ncbi:hypothetical protein V5T82_04000 [Magnetovibrio sp. PR-2]|uniref:hypothetical protein n=1 Tax=Magnetovibrio sp. PR-2 TaxID=3120356 RepID=UPI002FCE1DFC
MNHISHFSHAKQWEENAFKGFMELLNEADITQVQVFSDVLATAVHHSYISKKEIALQFEVDLSTVGRWVSGKSAPHKLVRPIICAYIREIAQKHVSITLNAKDMIQRELKAVNV